MPAADLAAIWTRGVIRVGTGRGFVVGNYRERFVITAAHCLPSFPPAIGQLSYTHERTFDRLLAPLDAEPSVMTECLFADPISDVAVLGGPDGQGFYDESLAYEAMVEAAAPVQLGEVQITIEERRVPVPGTDASTVYMPPAGRAPGWLLSLDQQWFRCTVTASTRFLGIEAAERPIEGGMSGSPIVDDAGKAIGIVCLGGDSPNPSLRAALPGWLYMELARREPRSNRALAERLSKRLVRNGQR